VKVGFTCGCFDALHSGHRHLLREAARQCDYLIVAVNDDNYCKRKGVGRPICTLEDRMWAINAYGETVGGHFSVIPFDGNDTLLAAFIKPDVVFRGHDQSETCGTIPVIRIGKGEQISTTVLVKSHTRSILK
jgi:D-beta-D-heptose 7-phosphate kinase/D-beta-D-heptose 1-phosphate adenosyltransferase